MIKLSTFDASAIDSASDSAIDSQKVDLDTSFHFGGGRGLGALVSTSPISPCSVCGSPILWETPEGKIRCYCCSPPASSLDVKQKIDVLVDEDGLNYAHFRGSEPEHKTPERTTPERATRTDRSDEDGLYIERNIFSRIVSGSQSGSQEDARAAAYRELDELLDDLWLATD